MANFEPLLLLATELLIKKHVKLFLKNFKWAAFCKQFLKIWIILLVKDCYYVKHQKYQILNLISQKVLTWWTFAVKKSTSYTVFQVTMKTNCTLFLPVHEHLQFSIVLFPCSTSPWDCECPGPPLTNFACPGQRTTKAVITSLTNSDPLSLWIIFGRPN